MLVLKTSKTLKNIIIDIPNISSEKYKCELVFLIPEFDLALLKTVSYKNKNFLELGNSDELIIGEQVFAVGFPKSINRSGSNNIKYTLGIISGHQDTVPLGILPKKQFTNNNSIAKSYEPKRRSI